MTEAVCMPGWNPAYSGCQVGEGRMRVGAVIWLRIAAVLVLVHGVLHTVGGVFGAAAPGVQADTVAAMKAGRFVAAGASRTY